MKFEGVEYLKKGTAKQQFCFRILEETNILNILANYAPIVVGTIPITIDIEGSDIDIACCAANLYELRDLVRLNFSTYNSFVDRLEEVYVASFEYGELPIEIYAESKPTIEQNGYRHMIIEDRIIKLAGDNFRQEIVTLKYLGYKTEPAFGELLNLNNPYLDLLEFEALTDEELQLLILEKHISG